MSIILINFNALLWTRWIVCSVFFFFFLKISDTVARSQQFNTFISIAPSTFLINYFQLNIVNSDSIYTFRISNNDFSNNHLFTRWRTPAKKTQNNLFNKSIVHLMCTCVAWEKLFFFNHNLHKIDFTGDERIVPHNPSKHSVYRITIESAQKLFSLHK